MHRCFYDLTPCLKMMWLVASQWLWTMGLVAGISSEFPNPQKEFQLCGSRNASFVCDPEFILDIGDVERLNQLALDFRKTTTCLCSGCKTGISLGIFIRSGLSQEAAKEYPDGKSVANMLRKRWHLGKCNDDIVIVLLTEMNISEYSMGPAVKEIFPDETARLIMKDCRAHFLSGWYYQGLESVVTSFNDVLVKLQKNKKSFDKSLIIGLSLGIGVILILFTFGLLILRRQNKRKDMSSDIYQIVPTKNHHENFLNDKINAYQLGKLHKQESEDDEESDDDNTFSPQFLQIKRQLSAVVEESDDNEGLSDKSLSFNNSLSLSKGTQRSTQVTEL